MLLQSLYAVYRSALMVPSISWRLLTSCALMQSQILAFELCADNKPGGHSPLQIKGGGVYNLQEGFQI